MIVLHLLNVAGCYWIFYAFQKRSKEELSHQLDIDRYAGSQAITIKLPLSNAQESDNSNYERVDGEFVYEGVTYRLVKQKFYQDTAYIVCYKDERTIAIKNALEDYVDTFTDIPTEKKSENKTEFSFIKDYLHTDKVSSLEPPVAVNVQSSTIYIYHDHHLLDFVIDHPPELIG